MTPDPLLKVGEEGRGIGGWGREKGKVGGCGGRKGWRGNPDPQCQIRSTAPDCNVSGQNNSFLLNVAFRIAI